MSRLVNTQFRQGSPSGFRRGSGALPSKPTGIETLMSAAHAAGYAMAPSEGLDRGPTVGLEPFAPIEQMRTADWEAVDAEAALRAAKAGPRKSRALVPVRPGAAAVAEDWFGLNQISQWFGGRATA